MVQLQLKDEAQHDHSASSQKYCSPIACEHRNLLSATDNQLISQAKGIGLCFESMYIYKCKMP